jgi:hypothetical protein
MSGFAVANSIVTVIADRFRLQRRVWRGLFRLYKALRPILSVCAPMGNHIADGLQIHSCVVAGESRIMPLLNMTQTILVRTRWGKRPESLNECRARLKDCFSRLANVGEPLAVWYEKLNKPTPERAVRWHDDSELERLLRKGILYLDLPREPIPDLGFSVGLWNGNHRRDGAELSICCGQYGPTANNIAMVKLRLRTY